MSSDQVALYGKAADLPVRLGPCRSSRSSRRRIPPSFFVRALVQEQTGMRKRDLWWKLVLDDDLPQHWRLATAYARPELRLLSRET